MYKPPNPPPRIQIRGTEVIIQGCLAIDKEPYLLTVTILGMVGSWKLGVGSWGRRDWETGGLGANKNVSLIFLRYDRVMYVEIIGGIQL